MPPAACHRRWQVKHVVTQSVLGIPPLTSSSCTCSEVTGGCYRQVLVPGSLQLHTGTSFLHMFFT